MPKLLEPLPSWDSQLTWMTFTADSYRTTYMGAELQKCSDDLARYREVVDVSQPDILVETGTREGGSALYFHRELGLQVVSIDIAPRFDRSGMPPWNGPGIHWVRGSSIAHDIVSQVIPLLRGKRVMVSLDSDHHSPHVQAEMDIWGALVSPGCYMVVEDACFEQWEPERARVGGARIPEFGGPQHAMITRFGWNYDKGREPGLQALSTGEFFWRDESVEGLTPVSHSPMGWWRKHE